MLVTLMKSKLHRATVTQADRDRFRSHITDFRPRRRFYRFAC